MIPRLYPEIVLLQVIYWCFCFALYKKMQLESV